MSTIMPLLFRSLLFLCYVLLTGLLRAQTGGTLLIVCNASGQVLMDGKPLADVEAGKPLVQQVSDGDHLVQFACTVNGKAEVKSEMVHVEPGKQKGVQFMLENAAVPAARDTLHVADLNFAITGSLAVGIWAADHKGEEYPYPTFYYTFEKGDVVVVDVGMNNAKGTNAIEVSTYPGHVVKYSNMAFASLKGWTFRVDERCILRIRLSTNHTFDRSGTMRVRRVPGSAASASFNTDVQWRPTFDTTYTVREEPYVIKSDTSIVQVVDQVAKVSSRNAISGAPNKTSVQIDLPEHTVAWSYYIGVGQAGRQAYDQARQKFLAVAEDPLTLLMGTGPLVPLALGGINYFAQVQGADDVHFAFIADWENTRHFVADEPYYKLRNGSVINDAGRMTAPLGGTLYLGLMNDNLMEPIEVTVKVTAVVVRTQMGRRTVKDQVVKERMAAYTAGLPPQ